MLEQLLDIPSPGGHYRPIRVIVDTLQGKTPVVDTVAPKTVVPDSAASPEQVIDTVNSSQELFLNVGSGNDNNMMLWAALAIIAALALCCYFIY